MDYKSWIAALDADGPQFLHAAFRIKDVEAVLRFYVGGLGMKLLDRIEFLTFTRPCTGSRGWACRS
jgi:catechol 2,3-dioxygenase-like lactoylglutathione lyase family enzyme